MHVYGSSSSTTNWLAGIGSDLASDGVTYGTFDASAYQGVTFWIRGSASAGFSNSARAAKWCGWPRMFSRLS